MSARPTKEAGGRQRLEFLDAVKGFAILGILYVHLVEEFGSGPLFMNTGYWWPDDLATRLQAFFPRDYDSIFLSAIQFFGWLGDAGPGVFILVSGFALTWSALPQGKPPSYANFLRRRVTRLFPLYVAAHFLFIATAFAVPGAEYNFGRKITLLSMLGLRFTDELFFYIAPAWWFVWTILQLYLVFPLLYRAMRRVPLWLFLAATISLTMLFRGMGILGIHPGTERMYYWLTGIFAGTRLAEFTVGMAAAAWLSRRLETGRALPAAGRVGLVAVPVYVAGLAISITWPGALVSNLVITLGLSGVFYAAFQGPLRNITPLARLITWLGVESYAIYLIHHTPLIWTRVIDSTTIQLVAALLVLGLSVPAGWLLDRGVGRLVASMTGDVWTLTWRSAAGVSAVLGLALTAVVEPLVISMLPEAETGYRALLLVLGVLLVPLLVVEVSYADKTTGWEQVSRWAAMAALPLTIWVLPSGSGLGTVAVTLVAAVCAVITGRWLTGRITQWAVGWTTTGLLLIALELALTAFAPLEAGRWGEYPALEPHPTRVYGLKPNTTVRLHYNNYDYTLRTNSLGLPGPEVEALGKDDLRVLVIGDAFTMPEGVEYEQAYPALLEDLLGTCGGDRRIDVVNAGVTGYGPVEQTAQLNELAPVLQPDVVVYQFFINEFQEVLIDPEERRAGIGFRPEGWRPLELPARLQLLARLERLTEGMRELLTGLPSPSRDWKALLRFYRLADAAQVYGDETLGVLREHLQRMARASESSGAEMLIALVPGAVAVSNPKHIAYLPWDQDLSDSTRYDMELPLRHLKEVVAPLRLPILDLTVPLQGHLDQPVYFPRSWHWNHEGHLVVALALARELARRGVVSDSCPALAGPNTLNSQEGGRDGR